MKALQLERFEHPNFVFLTPTTKRINNSVAWKVTCKHCGKQQLVGSSQAVRGTHQRCIYCQIPQETNQRELTT